MMPHRVLIVAASLTVRMDLHEAFEGDGFTSVLAATGEEARAAFRAGGFDAAVLDVLLPDADGLELLTELRAMPERAGVVTMLLSSEDEVADRLAELAEVLGLAAPTETAQSATDHLLAVLRRRRRWLLVFDDAGSPRQLTRFLPDGPGHVLIGSGDPAWTEHATRVAVTPWRRTGDEGTATLSF